MYANRKGYPVYGMFQAAQNITELTGQDISHQAAWDVVQKMGEKI